MKNYDINIKEAGSLTFNQGSQIESLISEIITCFTNESMKSGYFPVESDLIDPAIKLKYNSLNYKTTFHAYLLFHQPYEKAMKAFDNQRPFGKQLIMFRLNALYREILSENKILKDDEVDMEALRKNSNTIYYLLLKRISKEVKDSSNAPSHHEYIAAGVSVIMASAFIECEIFEKPQS